MRHAFDNVPHYQRRFLQAGVHPEDLRSLEDLGRFPLTTKGDLRDNYPCARPAVLIVDQALAQPISMVSSAHSEVEEFIERLRQ